MSIADLIISKGKVTRDLNNNGDRVRVDVTVDNIGGAAAGSSRVAYRLDGYYSTNVVDTDFVGTRPDSSHQFSSQDESTYITLGDHLTSAYGHHTYYLRATADYYNQVAEGNEGNNTTTLARIVAYNGNNGNNWMHALDSAYYIMTGNGGADQFIFHTPVGHGPNHVVHSITDFTSGVDQIKLHQHHSPGFPGLPYGTLDASRFQVSYNDAANATGSQATMLYNPNTGLLAFDSDGAGSAAALPVVKLGQGHRDLAAADIAVVWAG